MSEEMSDMPTHLNYGMFALLVKLTFSTCLFCRSITLYWTRPVAVAGRPSLRTYEKDWRVHMELFLQTHKENLRVDSEGLNHGSLRWKLRRLKITSTLARSLRLDGEG